MATTTTTAAPQTIQATAAPKGDVETTFNYFKEPNQVEKESIYGTAAFWRKTHVPIRTLVHDIRGQDGQFKLDVHGFEYQKRPTAVTDFSDQEEIKRVYYPECEKLLKEVTGCSRIFFMVHINRRHSPAEVAAKIADVPDDSEELLGLVPPLTHVHVDQSYKGITNMVSYFMPPAEAEPLKKVRTAIINVWRPLNTVRRDPLGLTDGRTIPDSDLVEDTTNLAKGRTNKTFGVTPPPVNPETGMQDKHQWHWCSEMTPEEIFIFKITDTKEQGVTRRCPHAAFHIAGTEKEETRQSLELRCLVFWEDEPLEQEQ